MTKLVTSQIGRVTEFNNSLEKKKMLIREIVKGLHAGNLENCFVTRNILVQELVGGVL